MTLVHSGTVDIGEAIDTGGGVFAVSGSRMTSLDSGATINTRGGNAFFDLKNGVDLNGKLETSGGALQITLYVGSGTVAPLFRVDKPIDFYAGSRITIDAGGNPLADSIGTDLRLDQIVKARRINQLALDVNLVNRALSDVDFVASLQRSGTDALDLLINDSAIS